MPGEREVRRAVVSVVRARLVPDPDPLPRWNGFAFNLRGMVFDGLWPPGVEAGTFLNLAECRFVGGPVSFGGLLAAG